MANAALRAPAQSTPTMGNFRTPEQALIGAFNACNLASSYIERGNFHAAKRKVIAALRSLETLTATKEGGEA